MKTIDLEGGRRTRIVGSEASAPDNIVLVASAPGLPDAQLTILVSADADQHGPLAVAARSLTFAPAKH